MDQLKTPGVYVAETNAFPNSVVEVATAVPAFIGHTEKADNHGKSLTGTPWRIASFEEYARYFGAAPAPRFDIALNADSALDIDFSADGKDYRLSQAPDAEGGRYLLYYGLRHFFENGGGACYIVSVGDYRSAIERDKLIAGIELLTKEQEPTLLVVPESILLDEDECGAVQRAMLAHCGLMGDRMSILDIRGGWRSEQDSHCIADFRDGIGVDHLDFGAAYYPWVNTSIVQDADLNFECISVASRGLFIDLLERDAERAWPPSANARPEQQQHDVEQARRRNAAIESITADFTAGTPTPDAATIASGKAALDKTLTSISPLYRSIVAAVKRRLNLLPPSAAMAGVYTTVDDTRGLWKAPANVSINGIVSPAVDVTAETQDSLNVDPLGKSINAIRAFAGEGVLVWGARTLDGNSPDRRYVNVRRTLIMLEQSSRLAAQALVFEPNVANTWVTLKSMLANFLTSVWKRGGLAGATPEDAFAVHVGLGDTMTAEDVLDGILRVTVLVALVRPAEFVEFTFQQRMLAPS